MTKNSNQGGGGGPANQGNKNYDRTRQPAYKVTYVLLCVQGSSVQNIRSLEEDW